MKRLLALMLSTVLVAGSLCGCGDEAEEETREQKQKTTVEEERAEPSEKNQETEQDEKDNDAQKNDAGFLTYEELSDEEHLWVDIDHYMAVNMPASCESYSNGVSTRRYTGFEYYYIAACATEMMPDADLEEAFLTFLNREDSEGFRGILKSISSATYDEIAPEMETVILDSGREAIKFSGIVHKDDYGSLYDCPIYGYGIMCGDVPVITCYLIADPDDFANEEVTEEELVQYVDKMANTPRLEAW